MLRNAQTGAGETGGMEPFERYRSLIDDFEAFQAACERPLPRTVRVNTIKVSTDEVQTAFADAGIDTQQVDWTDDVLEVDTNSPGATWPSMHGWIHTQEEVSTLPPVVLDPQPGEIVWDAAAAPGSKATQLAAQMDDEGRLIANDTSLGRLSALRFNAERLGVTNVAVTNTDGRNYSLKPFSFDEFDRALVDAPCSGEGTIRKNPDAIDDWTIDHVESVSGIQKGLLRRAVQATKPGGRVVYSTCTLAPEENEAVLDYVLDAEDCRIVEQSLPLDHRPGVTEWHDQTYDPSVERAARIYPHLNDTGGFFIATLEVGT